MQRREVCAKLTVKVNGIDVAGDRCGGLRDRVPTGDSVSNSLIMKKIDIRLRK